MNKTFALLSLGLLVLTACEGEFYDPTLKPDYTIRVMPDEHGKLVAVPPTCANWATAPRDPYDNQLDPNFGCATARNLALTAEHPEDLVHGKDMGPASGVTTVGALRRYNNSQTRGLIWTGTDPNVISTTTSPAPASTLTGDIAGGAAGGTGSSSSAAPSAGP